MRARETPERRGDGRRVPSEKSRAAQDPVTQILALQRATGNAAVANMVQLARRPKERPASTDAPWVKGKGKKPASSSSSAASSARPPLKKKRLQGLTQQQMSWDRPALVARAMDAMNDKGYDYAAALLERAYELQPTRDIALNIYRAWKAMGDNEQAEYWMKVTNGVIKPGSETGERPVSEQQF